MPGLAARYLQGDFLTAAEGAEALGSPDALALAARSLLANVLTGGEVDLALVERAQRDAEAALKLDGRHAEGRLQLAIALSLRLREMGAIEAWRTGAGERSRRLAEDVLADEPANHYAHGFLAVWHVEVRRRGGPVGARAMGASLQEAARRYASAAQLAPDDVGIHWQYARALAAFDLPRFRDEVQSALDAAQSAATNDAVEVVMQQRARDLADLIRRDADAAAAMALSVL